MRSVVDPLSSKDLAIVVDFHRFTDCHLEAIFDVNNVVTSAANFYTDGKDVRLTIGNSSSSEPGSARYSSTPSLTTV